MKNRTSAGPQTLSQKDREEIQKDTGIPARDQVFHRDPDNPARKEVDDASGEAADDPADAEDEAVGDRTDGRDLVEELERLEGESGNREDLVPPKKPSSLGSIRGNPSPNQP